MISFIRHATHDDGLDMKSAELIFSRRNWHLVGGSHPPNDAQWLLLHDVDNILVIMDVWFGSTHEQIQDKFEIWGLGYPAYRLGNLLQSMTSNFSPFPILFDDLLPSLSSAAHLIFTLHLLLPPHNLHASLCFYPHCASRGERSGFLEWTFGEIYRIPCSFLSRRDSISLDACDFIECME
jgi:hypothetical protein